MALDGAVGQLPKALHENYNAVREALGKILSEIVMRRKTLDVLDTIVHVQKSDMFLTTAVDLLLSINTSKGGMVA